MEEQELEYKFNKALEYEHEGKLLHAVQIYTSLLKTDSFKRDSSIQLHKIYENWGNIGHSSSLLRNYLDENSGDFELRKYYSLFLIKHHHYEEAVEQLSRISSSEIAEVKFLAGLARFFMKDYESAVINFTEFIGQNNSTEYLYDAYLYLAKTQLELNNIDKALEAAKGADKISSGSEELQLILTKIYLLKGMNFHAFDSVSRGLRINNESRQMNELAGRISFDMGEYDKAENHLRKLLNNNEQSDEVFTLLGIIYIKKNDFAKAEEMFNKALEINPENIPAIENKRICAEYLEKQNIVQ